MPEQPPPLAERLLRRLAPRRGRRYFRIEPPGAEGLATAKHMLRSMRKGVRLA